MDEFQDFSASPVSCSFDLTASGKNMGYLKVPHSVHRSAYGFLPMPLARFHSDTPGPNILISSGVHGDEYEGQVITSSLIRELEIKDIAGTLTLLPMANFPAAQAGLRTSPIDEDNLNRIFPGSPFGSPTPVIAHCIETVLMPGVDLYLDLHSGGSSMYCHPFAFGNWDENREERNALRRTILEEAGLFAALMETGPEAPWFTTSAADRAGGVGFTFELGGSGTIDPEIVAGGKAGILRILKAVGAYLGPEPSSARLSSKCRMFDGDALLYAMEAGIYEPLAKSGEDVKTGQPAARIHIPETPGMPPIELAFEQDGMILAHRIPARVERGDCLFHIAVETSWSM